MPTNFNPMPNYRRSYVPGGAFFLTLATYWGRYEQDWGCVCGEKTIEDFNFQGISWGMGE